MILGILSDSHGRAAMVRRAVAIFDEAGAETLVHCGDVGGIEVFDELVDRLCRFVWGNCDVPSASVRAFLDSVGLPAPDGVPLRFSLGGKRFALFHGHEPEARRMESIDGADYVLHGHSHVRRDERIGAMRIINPGALHRASPRTVATLNIENDELVFYEVG